MLKRTESAAHVSRHNQDWHCAGKPGCADLSASSPYRSTGAGFAHAIQTHKPRQRPGIWHTAARSTVMRGDETFKLKGAAWFSPAPHFPDTHAPSLVGHLLHPTWAQATPWKNKIKNYVFYGGGSKPIFLPVERKWGKSQQISDQKQILDIVWKSF